MNFKVWILLLAAATLSWSCSEETQSQEAMVKTVNVQTRNLEPQTFESYLQLIGTVEAVNDIRISAEESGRMVSYLVEEGDPVKKGQLIAKIDDRQLVQEEARMQAVTEQARETYERQKRLWQQDSIGSEIDYLNAKYNYEQQKASLESIRVRLENTEIRAPFSGVLEEKLIDEGEMAQAGIPVIRLIANDRIKVVVGVPARYSDVIGRGDNVQVWFDTVQSDTLEGRVTFAGSSIDPQARTFRVEAVVPNTQHRYKVDMVANVQIKTIFRPEALVVGEEYVYQKKGGYVVYTVGQNGDGEAIAREHVVELGPSYMNKVVLEEGIQAGEELITVGSSFLKDSMRIKIVNAPTTSLAEQNMVQ